MEALLSLVEADPTHHMEGTRHFLHESEADFHRGSDGSLP